MMFARGGVGAGRSPGVPCVSMSSSSFVGMWSCAVGTLSMDLLPVNHLRRHDFFFFLLFLFFFFLSFRRRIHRGSSSPAHRS